MPRFAVRLTVAVLVAASVGLGAPQPAQAASCSTAHGVTVVVDFHQLGGGVQTFCDVGGAGKYADAQLGDAGHALAYVQRQPGFVCRVDGAPSSDPCVNTPPSDAYWSLWWSDGKSGRWTYASTGVGSLRVPDGGYVGLSWQGGDGKAAPGVTPTIHASASPTASPTRHPSSSPTRHAASSPTGSPASSATTSSPTATPSGSPNPTSSATSTHPARHQRHPPHKTPTVTPTADPTDLPATTQAAEPLDSAAAGSDSGLPGWVAPVLVGGLFVAAGAVALVRRKRAGGA